MSLGDGAPTASDNGATVPNSDDGQLRDKRRRLQRALQSLRAYNPEFRLTPEVLEIMRVFFDDLKPDASDTISLGAIAREIERLDPDKQLVPDDTRHRMWREIEGSARGDDFRLDFPMFCRWVLRWREINPLSVQNVYETWARELATVDFGTSEGEDVYVVIRPDDALSSEELAKGIKELLHARKKQQRDGAELTKRRSFGAQDDAGANPSLESSPASQTPKDDEFENEDGGQSKDGPVAALAKKGSIITTSKSFIAGGAAGIVAKSMLAPMDRVKMLFQVTDKHKFSFRNAILLGRQIVAQDGAQALFRGNMLNIVRVVPYAGIQHSGFDYFRRRFRAYNYRHAEPGEAPKLSNAQLVAAGSLAGALSLMIAYPLDTIRARYMVQHGKLKYHSVFDAVMTMYRVDGIRSFSKGLVPSLIGTLPYTGIGFSLNERFKYWVRLRFRHVDRKDV